MFNGASAFNQNLASWNVASVANLYSMFYSAGASFNQNIGGWSVSSATDLRYMFSSGSRWVLGGSLGYTCNSVCSSSSQTCSELSWPTSAITMSAAFYTVGSSCNSTDFSYDYGAISPWYISGQCYSYTASASVRCSATSSSYYRLCACVSSSAAFNQNIGGGNVARVSNLYGMLHGAAGFNQNLGSWNVASVSNLAAALDFASGLSFGNKRAMYMGWGSTLRTWYPTWGLVDSNIASAVTWWVSAPSTAAAAYGPIGSWDTSGVTTFASLFSSKPTFNDNIGSWNTASVTTLYGSFDSASAFNQNIGSWNVARVGNMVQLFYSASAFNQNIGSWNVAQLSSFSSVFYSSDAFNQDISIWNTARGSDMSNVRSLPWRACGWLCCNRRRSEHRVLMLCTASVCARLVCLDAYCTTAPLHCPHRAVAASHGP